ncbi:tetratricopeptide (TPR) repeat protein [Bacillus ectoiniformans]|uniref:hypothetical protein n=1 Tax=Bacillus ectoiniformans TaxID=1494429 RepID=UPI0019593B88|nr:hypothetical protein [Bacillus ectoiniformans]MBM7647486.1 tetratricopeptide (TPR) repeat protein [Bacillus ectoiniformans]
MRLRDKTIEELLDLEQDLHAAKEEEKTGSLYQIITVYEEIYKRIDRDRNSEYKDSLKIIKHQLVSYLIRYGSYLKMDYQKDDHLAESTLKKALTYDRQNPLAHYRLGFLSYKKRKYVQALLHFQNAANSADRTCHRDYILNEQQLYNLHLYLTNSALYIAQKSTESLDRIQGPLNRGGVPHLEMSPMYKIIQQNEQILESQAFTKMTKSEEIQCSKEDCEEELDLADPNTLILYFADLQNSVFYHQREMSLTKDQAEILRYFFFSTEERPVVKQDLYALFEQVNLNGEIEDNTFIQRMRRLKRKLVNFGLPETVIQNKRPSSEPAYYFDENIPFLVMHRSDRSFMLNR